MNKTVYTDLQHGSECTECPTKTYASPMTMKPAPDFAETFSITTSESWNTLLGHRMLFHSKASTSHGYIIYIHIRLNT